MKLYQNIKILRIKGNVHENISDRVVREVGYKLVLNGVEKEIIYCSPDKLRELAVGCLYEEGLINTIEDILSIAVKENSICIKTKKSSLKERNENRQFSVEDDNLLIDPDKIFRIVKTLTQCSVLFQETGGVHNALLSSLSADNLIFREDVSRNNTVNKIIGNILINKISPYNKVLAVSSRVSFFIMNKIVKIGIPVVVSISAPTDRAINLAENAGITLVAFAREQRMNVYTHKERINTGGRP